MADTHDVDEQRTGNRIQTMVMLFSVWNAPKRATKQLRVKIRNSNNFKMIALTYKMSMGSEEVTGHDVSNGDVTYTVWGAPKRPKTQLRIKIQS